MKNDFATKADLEKTADGLHRGIASVKKDVSVLKKDVSVLKNDVSVLKKDVSVLKLDVSILKEDVGLLKQDMILVKKDVAHLNVRMDQVSDELHEFKQETGERFDGVMTAIDGLAGLIRNGQTEKAAVDHALQRHDGILGKHEKRIGSLEENRRQP